MNAWRNIAFVVAVVVLLVVVSLIFTNRISPDAAIAFLGVLLGLSITSLLQYSVAQANRKDALGLAALDLRLQARQEAYAKWYNLLWADWQSPEFAHRLTECQDWWASNCLYLEPDARAAFFRAYHAAMLRGQLLAQHGDPKVIDNEYKTLESAGPVIEKATYLSPIPNAKEEHIVS